MSTFKKVISIVLCFSLLAGSFAFLGDLIVPKASAAGESHITKTYDELAAAYDNFLYLGIDVYEVKNDELTDGYVKSGDWLEYRMTILSDMYIGQSYPLVVYDNDFFDIRVVSSTTEATSDTYEGNKSTDLLNHDHPSYEEGWSTNVLTSKPCVDLGKYTEGTMGMAASLYEGWDQFKTNWKVVTTAKNEAFIMKEDTWFANWYVRVKDDLADGTTGVSQSRYDLYKFVVPYTYDADGNCVITSNKPASAVSGKLGDVLTADWSATVPKATACKVGNLRYSNINWFNVDDTVHTFTIGDAPTGPAVEKKTVTFLENDGTQISATEYEPGKPVALPAAVADQYGWADVATGAIVALENGFAMPEKNVTYKRVLTTDEFDITVNLDGGSVEDASLLPEGTTANADGSVTIKAPIGTEIDLNDALPAEALTKPGYKAAEWAEAAKIENINGLKVKISWVADVFNVTFYYSEDDYNNNNVLNETTVEYNKTVGYSDISKGNTNADSKSKFAGWADAETGEVVSTSATFKYTMTEDKAFYATWTDKKYTVTLNVRDYENGGWKVLAAKYADSGSLSLNDIKAVAENAGYVYYGPSSTSDTFNRISAAVAYDADKTIYLFTKTNISVTWQVPTFDEATGEVTDNYNSETVTGETGGISNAFETNIATTLSTDAHTGYKFVGWFDEDGVQVSYDSAVGAKFNTVDGLKRTITAKYELVEYTIKFDLQNGALKDEYVIEGTFNIGDEINVADVKVIDTKTNATAYLPTIGLENKEQPNGSYRDRDGYKFTGWQRSEGGGKYVAVDVSKPITITEEIIKKSVSNDVLIIYGMWESEYYDLVYYYESGTDEQGNPTYTALDPIKVKTGESLSAYEDAAEEIAKANLPAGKTFVSFKLNGDVSSNVTTMPAYGAEFYATYSTKPIKVYIDFNFGTEENPLTAKETMDAYKGKYNPFYGFDVEFVPEPTEQDIAPISLTQDVMSTSFGADKKPGERYEVVEWKIYHVADGKDIYDRANWVEGVNDEGTSLAKSNIIYQIQWKSHGDFLFRVYDTEHGLSRALGKDFKMYYWYNGFVRDKDTAGDLNRYPETNIIIFFVPEIENWDWNGFFDINMWKSLTLKIEPFDINKSSLNPKNWGALLKALFSGIGSGFGSNSGEEEAE